MTIEPGTRIGPYEVVGPLGAGGMGVVHRAKDTRLGREVALKFLPPGFAEDPERHARFEREAKLLASLNHPHIAVLYGLEHIDGQHALAMELVEGEGLDERIARGPLPVEDAAPIALQIADALEAAHEKGIVHRDLKPANVRVRPDGVVKVLDFGLAKAWDEPATGVSELAHSPTITGHHTRAGVILGTAAYMSPEQARGKPVDKRADVWAFGCVLYEMLAGRKAFEGETASDTLAAVLKSEPDLGTLPAQVPVNVRRLIARCLQKEPRQRLRDVGDAALELTERGGVERPHPATVTAAPRRRWLAWAAPAAACVLGLAAGGALFHRAARAPLVRASLPPPADAEYFLASRQPGPASVSPDGTRIVFAARDEQHGVKLWLRRLDSVDATPLPDTDNASYPFWAPNGSSLGFFAGGKLKRIDLQSGSVVALADAPFGKSGTWNERDVIVYAPSYNSGLLRVSAQGGTATAVTRLDPVQHQNSHRFPQFLPDGDHFVFLVRAAGESGRVSNRVMVGSLSGGEPKALFETATNVAYSAGFLLYTRERLLVARRFDPRSLQLSGEEIPVAAGVSVMSGAALAMFSVSVNGVLVYGQGKSATDARLTWFDRQGRSVGTVGPPAIYQSLAVAPDGRRVAVEEMDATTGQVDVWVLDADRGIPVRATFGGSESSGPAWMPDGRTLLFRSRRTGALDLFRTNANGSGEAQPVLASDTDKQATSVSPDGRFLAFRAAGKETRMDVWILPLDGSRPAYPLLQSRFDEEEARFSPDGRWLAFQSNESGRNEIYVTSFPQRGERLRASSEGGVLPRWSSDGRELYYRSEDANDLFAVSARETEGSLELGPPARLFRVQHATLGGFEAAGGRFLMIIDEDIRDRTPLALVMNWTSLARGGGA